MKNAISIGMTLLFLLLIAWGGWRFYHRYLCPMRIAIVAPGDSGWVMYREAAEGTHYAVHRYLGDDIATAPFDQYDVLIMGGMGWLPTDAEVANIEKAAARGTAVYVGAATQKRTQDLNNIPEEIRKKFVAYLQAGGAENARNGFKFLARELKGHAVEVADPVERPSQGYFHLDETLYETVEEFEASLDAKYPNLPENAPRIVLFGAFINVYDALEREPVDEIVRQLTTRGCRVYCMMGMRDRLERIEACRPDAAILFPMGRMAGNNEAPPFLERLNIPCFDAIQILEAGADWKTEPVGMSGMYMNQTIVMPELDGVIEPTAVAIMAKNDDGLTVRRPIRERVEMLARRINRWITLKRKPNADKKIAIVYYKGPGDAPLVAGGMETIDSLYNVLCRMKADGYDLGEEFPGSSAELFELIRKKGRVIGQWAQGGWEEYLEEGDPELVPAGDYARWLQHDLPEPNRRAIVATWGDVPGKQMTVQRDGKPYLVVTRVKLGNIVLMPQPSTAIITDTETAARLAKETPSSSGNTPSRTAGPPGESAGKASSENIAVKRGEGVITDEMSAVHGTDQSPPHFYLGAYLWIRHGFQADALMHFGTHGSLEFTKGKSGVLSDECWPTILTGDLPHIYPYIVSNIGEALIAKRRSSAVTVSHLMPPFTKSELYGDLLELDRKIYDYQSVEGETLKQELLRSITDLVRKNDMFKEIGYRENPPGDALLTAADFERLHEYLEHLEDTNITDGLHVIDRPWTDEQILETTIAMLGDRGPERIEKIRAAGKIADLPTEKQEALKRFAADVLAGKIVSEKKEEPANSTESQTMPSMPPRGAGSGHPGGMPPGAAPAGMGGPPNGMTGMGAMMGMGGMNAEPKKTAAPEDPFEDLIAAVKTHAEDLKNSLTIESQRIMTALGGGYIPPSSGGDVISNPAAAPTGRNIGSINIEQTPSEEAYRVGMKLTDDILADYKATHAPDAWPRRVALTVWGGDYIQTRGVLVAQAFYLMGLRLRRDSRGIVFDVEVIPSEELGRPRIDILMHTSVQFRDAAISRIELVDKAVSMVAALPEEKFPNYVRENSHHAEAMLKQQGHSASKAREYSTARIFGSSYIGDAGPAVSTTVDRSEADEAGLVADRFLANRGAVYRGSKEWGIPVKGLMESQLHGTELVLQARASNSWGPLGLDHVYQFNTISLAVREKTGTDPTMWFSDLRNPNRPKAQTAVQAIREEARTEFWNPKYITGQMREGAGAAAGMTETIRNLRGWTVVQPSAIDQSIWDEMFNVYIDDKHELGMKEYFEAKNPAALQDMTAIMLDTIRKGLWKPDAEVVKQLAELHVEMVEKHGARCSRDTCGDAKLHAFLGDLLPEAAMNDYRDAISQVLETRATAPREEVEGMRLEEKIELLTNRDRDEKYSAPLFICLIFIGMLATVVLGFTGRFLTRRC